MPRRLTREGFIEKATLTHGDTFNYNKVEYINNSTKVQIECKVHGYFLQSPNAHMMGQGCKSCQYDSISSTREDFSDIKIPQGARLIPLTRGQYALVDEADYDGLNKYRWSAAKGALTYYACRTTKDYSTGKVITIRMHSEVLGNSPDRDRPFIDHINKIGTDNRRSNLRFCSMSENMRNRNSQPGSSSKYLGVQKNKNSWQASINANGKKMYLGTFSDEVEAAKAYDKAALNYHKEFANVNFHDTHNEALKASIIPAN
jgi:hypothetical protein